MTQINGLEIEGDTLSGCCFNIRSAVKRLWYDHALRHYTDHTVAHSDRIMEVLIKLMGNKVELNKYEKFILFASVYLHDIGMQIPPNLVVKKKYSRAEEKLIRDQHNNTSAVMIENSVKPRSSLPSLGLESCSLCAEFIAQVCKYHRVLPMVDLKDTPFLGETIRIPLLTALLRLGDELDADWRRVCMSVLKITPIPLESKYHWWSHHYVKSVEIVDRQITLSFVFPSEYEGTPLVDALRNKVVNSVKHQCSEVANIFSNYGVQTNDVAFEDDYRNVVGLERVPSDLERHIYGPVHMSNVNRCIDELSSSDAKVRRRAAHLLGVFGYKKALDPLATIMTDVDEDVRLEATDAIGRIYEKRKR